MPTVNLRLPPSSSGNRHPRHRGRSAHTRSRLRCRQGVRHPQRGAVCDASPRSPSDTTTGRRRRAREAGRVGNRGCGGLAVYWARCRRPRCISPPTRWVDGGPPGHRLPNPPEFNGFKMVLEALRLREDIGHCLRRDLRGRLRDQPGGYRRDAHANILADYRARSSSGTARCAGPEAVCRLRQ